MLLHRCTGTACFIISKNKEYTHIYKHESNNLSNFGPRFCACIINYRLFDFYTNSKNKITENDSNGSLKKDPDAS